MRSGGAAGSLGAMLTARIFRTGLLLALAPACDRARPEPDPAARVAPESPPSLPSGHPPVATRSSTGDDLGLAWHDPPTWKRVTPTSPLRKASYVVPRAPGDAEDGEMAVFFFGGGMGGSTEDNVQRWVGQFGDVPKDGVKRSDRSGGGMPQHLVEIERGTFSSGMPGGPSTPKKDFALLGAIVDAPVGKVFFKLTGPVATVAAARPAFVALLDGVRAK